MTTLDWTGAGAVCLSYRELDAKVPGTSTQRRHAITTPASAGHGWGEEPLVSST